MTQPRCHLCLPCLSMKLAIPLTEELNNILSTYNWEAFLLSRYLTSAAEFGAWSRMSELPCTAQHKKRGIFERGCPLGIDPADSPK